MSTHKVILTARESPQYSPEYPLKEPSAQDALNKPHIRSGVAKVGPVGPVGPRPYQLVQVPYQLEPYRPAFSFTGATQQPV